MALFDREKRRQRGQSIAMAALLLPALLLFVGLAIDLGFARLSKATLAKASDAAVLAAVRNMNKGQAQAKTIATSAFNLNYKSSLHAHEHSAPVVNVAITTNSGNNTVVTVDSLITFDTFFLGILPQFKTLTITSHAQATRPNIVMSLVLDRSGSMNKNGGAQALAPAVNQFLDYFDDNTDRAAMVSFSSTSKVDVTLRSQFKSPITTATNGLAFGGGTFAQGGLLDGQAQVDTVASSPSVLKVAVFFTDGWANTDQDKLNCPASTLLNYGGCAPPEQSAGWCSGFSFINPNTGSGRSCGATKFPSQQSGTMQPLSTTNISNEAIYRAVQLSNNMRGGQILIYSIGLGDKISRPFLQQVANDPASSTFDANQLVGEAVFAPTAADLQGVFETIASKILLRLTQ